MQKLFRAWPQIEWELRPHHFVFAADNGIVAAGVVAQDQDITYLQAKNMVEGRAAISCFCKVQQVRFPWWMSASEVMKLSALTARSRRGRRTFSRARP